MANNFAADFKAVWAKEQQRIFFKTNIARVFADTSFEKVLTSGQTLNRPYRSSNSPQRYTRGTAITIDDKTDTQETLTVNAQFATGFYEDDFDKIQSNYDLAAAYGKDDGIYLSNQVDADVLGEVANASSVVDDGTLGGTSGNGIIANTSNLLSIFSAAKKKLTKLNIPTERLFAGVSPELEEVLIQYAAGRDTKGGDDVQHDGFIMNFYGFKIYRSNQLAGTAVLSLVTQPTNGDTVTIQGQVFTFVSSIGTTAGNVLIGANVDVTRASFATLINAPTVTTATGVALTGNAARNFTNLASAVNDNTADTLTVTYKGAGVLSVSETLTDATDTWTSAKIIQQNVFGAMGAPTLLMQEMTGPTYKEVPDKFGKNILNGVLYGYKTYADNAKMLVNVKLNASSF